MTITDQREMTGIRTDRPRVAEIRPTPTHDGLRRALKSSFASPPALPEDIARLLARLD